VKRLIWWQFIVIYENYLISVVVGLPSPTDSVVMMLLSSFVSIVMLGPGWGGYFELLL